MASIAISPLLYVPICVGGISLMINVATITKRGWYPFTKWLYKKKGWIIMEERFNRSKTLCKIVSLLCHQIICSLNNDKLPITNIEIDGATYLTVKPKYYITVKMSISRERQKELKLKKNQNIFYIYGSNS